MIASTLKIQENVIIHLCTVCVTDNNGAKIALSIIILSLALLGLANWAWKKYLASKKEATQQK